MGIVSSKGGMYLEVGKIFSIKYTNKYLNKCLNRYPNLFTILIPALLLKACGPRDAGAPTILSDNVVPYSGYPGEINTLFLEGNPYSFSDARNDGFSTSLTQKQLDVYGYGNVKIIISGLPTDEQFQFRMVMPENTQSSYDDVSGASDTETAVQYANDNAINIQNGQDPTQYQFQIYSINHLSFFDSLQLLIPEDYNYQEVEDQEIILTISIVAEIKIPGTGEETMLYPLESKAYAISLNQQPVLKLIGTQKDKINEGQTQMREQIATYEFRDTDHSETMFNESNFLLYYIKIDDTIEQIADNGKFIAQVDYVMGQVQIKLEENKLFSYDDNSGKLHVEQQGTAQEQKFFKILIAAFDDISKKYITQGSLIYKTDDQGNPYIEIPTQVGNQEVIKVISSDSLQILRLGVIDQPGMIPIPGVNAPSFVRVDLVDDHANTQGIATFGDDVIQLEGIIAQYQSIDLDTESVNLQYKLYYLSETNALLEVSSSDSFFDLHVQQNINQGNIDDIVSVNVKNNAVFDYQMDDANRIVSSGNDKYYQLLLVAFDERTSMAQIDAISSLNALDTLNIALKSRQLLRIDLSEQTVNPPSQDFDINLPSDGIIDIYYAEIPSGQMVVDPDELRLFTSPITVSGGYDHEAEFSLLTSTNPYIQKNEFGQNIVIREGEKFFDFDAQERLISFKNAPDYETPFTNNGGHISTNVGNEQDLIEANIYSFILQVYLPSLDRYEQKMFKVHVSPVNEAPIIRFTGGGLSRDLSDNTAEGQLETTIKVSTFLRYFDDDKYPADHQIDTIIFRKADSLEQDVASRFSFSYQGNTISFVDEEIRIDNVNGMYDEDITISAPYFGDGSYDFLYTVADYRGLVADGSLSVVFNINEPVVLTPLGDPITISEESTIRQGIKTYHVSDTNTGFDDISYELYKIDKDGIVLQVSLFQINIDGSFDDFSASNKMFGIVVDGQQQMVEFWLRSASNIDFESSSDNYLLEDQNGDKYMSFRVVAKDGQRVLSVLNPIDYDYQKDFNVYIENVDDNPTQFTASDTLSFDAILDTYIILSPENMQLNSMGGDYSVLVEDADNRNVDLTISLLERPDDYDGRLGSLASYFDLVPVLGEQGRLKFEVKNSVPLPDYEAPYGVENPENLSPIELLAANTYKLFFTIEGDEGSLFETLSYDVDISIVNVDDNPTQFTASDTLSFDANLNAYIILSPENMQLNFMDEDYSVLVEDADNNRNVYTTSLLERSDDYVGRTGLLADYFDLVPVLGEQGRLKFEVKNSVPLPDYEAPYGVANPENLSPLELLAANTYKLFFTIEGDEESLFETLSYDVDISIVNANDPPFVILSDDQIIQLGSIPFGRKASFDINKHFISGVFKDLDGSVEKIFFTSTPDDVSYIALAPEALIYTNLNSHLEVIENSKYDIDVRDTTIVIDTAALNDQDKKYYVGSYRVDDDAGDSSLDTVRFSFTVDAARGFAPSLSLGQIFARSDQDGEKTQSYYSNFKVEGVNSNGVVFFSYSDQDIFGNTRSDEYLIIDAQNVFIKAEGKDSYFLQHSAGVAGGGLSPDFFPQQEIVLDAGTPDEVIYRVIPEGEYSAVDLDGDASQELVVLNQARHLEYYHPKFSTQAETSLFEGLPYSYMPEYFNAFRGIEPVLDPFSQITDIDRAPLFVKFGNTALNYDFVVVNSQGRSLASELRQYSIVTDINDDSYGSYKLLSPEDAYVSVIKGAGTDKENFNVVFRGSMPVFTDVDSDGNLDMFVLECVFLIKFGMRYLKSIDIVYYHYDPNGQQGPSFYDDNVNKITFSGFIEPNPSYDEWQDAKLYALDLEGQDGRDDHLLLTTIGGTSFLYSFSITGNTGTLTEIYFNKDFSNNFNFLPQDSLQGYTPRAIAFGDLDDDGDADLVLAVQNSINNNIEIRYYQNQGGSEINLDEQFGDDNPFDSITIGDGSYEDGKLPYMELFDIDLDGDLDFIFGDGKYGDGIKYCLNIGDDQNPSYGSAIDLRDARLVPSVNVQNVLDISFEILKDNQGNDVVVAVVAIKAQTPPLYYYQIEKDANTGILTLVNPVPELSSNIGGLAVDDIRSAFYDVDGDGLVDMVFGEEDGSLSYYRAERDATTGALSFNVQSGINVRDLIISDDQYNSVGDPFDGLDFGSNVSPSFVDLDGDFEDELVVINDQGDIFYIENSWIDAAWTGM